MVGQIRDCWLNAQKYKKILYQALYIRNEGFGNETLREEKEKLYKKIPDDDNLKNLSQGDIVEIWNSIGNYKAMVRKIDNDIIIGTITRDANISYQMLPKGTRIRFSKDNIMHVRKGLMGNKRW